MMLVRVSVGRGRGGCEGEIKGVRVGRRGRGGLRVGWGRGAWKQGMESGM